MSRRVRNIGKLLIVLPVLFLIVGTFSGCASFRKKFVRQKKDKSAEENIIPVLQPVEYKSAELSSADRYAAQYSMAKAYLKDIWEVLGEADATDKQQLYIFREFIVRLQGMEELLVGEKKEDLEKILVKVRDVVKEYDKPGLMRRYDLMKMSVREAEDAIRHAFKPEMVTGFLQSEVVSTP